VRSLSVDDSTIGVTTESSNSRVNVFSFETTGPVAMAADKAERPSSGAKLARMIRPIRTEVLLIASLALPPSQSRLWQTREGNTSNAWPEKEA